MNAIELYYNIVIPETGDDSVCKEYMLVSWDKVTIDYISQSGYIKIGSSVFKRVDPKSIDIYFNLEDGKNEQTE